MLFAGISRRLRDQLASRGLSRNKRQTQRLKEKKRGEMSLMEIIAVVLPDILRSSAVEKRHAYGKQNQMVIIIAVFIIVAFCMRSSTTWPRALPRRSAESANGKCCRPASEQTSGPVQNSMYALCLSRRSCRAGKCSNRCPNDAQEASAAQSVDESSSCAGPKVSAHAKWQNRGVPCRLLLRHKWYSQYFPYSCFITRSFASAGAIRTRRLLLL